MFRVQNDLINFKNYGKLKSFECSSPHWFWNGWYQIQRPKGFSECYKKFKREQYLKK